jgi:hypothetical protein
MEKKISGWGNNKFANSKIYYPNNISEIKNLIKKKFNSKRSWKILW